MSRRPAADGNVATLRGSRGSSGGAMNATQLASKKAATVRELLEQLEGLKARNDELERAARGQRERQVAAGRANQEEEEEEAEGGVRFFHSRKAWEAAVRSHRVPPLELVSFDTTADHMHLGEEASHDPHAPPPAAAAKTASHNSVLEGKLTFVGQRTGLPINFVLQLLGSGGGSISDWSVRVPLPTTTPTYLPTYLSLFDALCRTK